MKHLFVYCLLMIATVVQAVQPNFDQINSTSHGKNIAKQWGIDALQIPKIVNPINTNITTFEATNSKFYTHNLLMENDIKNSTLSQTPTVYWRVEHFYVEAAIEYDDQTFKQHNNINRIVFGYTGNRFSAESTVKQSLDPLNDSALYQVQGAYKLYKQDDFSIALTAKIALQESNNPSLIEKYLEPISIQNITENRSGLNTTFGVVTTWHLSKNWQLFGSLSSQNINPSSVNELAIDDKHIHSATIATRYSF